MSFKRILTFQDLSCVGQCSLGVAVPIISACGHEVAALPSALLSNHTGSSFSGYTFTDLSADTMPICEELVRQNIDFDCFYSGYLGSITQIEYAKKMMDTLLKKGGVRVVDPAMADHGHLYAGFDLAYAEKMRELCLLADIVLPNITEAAMMCGIEYREEFDREYIENILDRLTEMGMKRIVMTGVTFEGDRLGVAVRDNGKTDYYFHQRLGYVCHGTGDIYASAFVGAYLNGFSCLEAASIAARFTLSSILATSDRDTHTYGVRFERAIPSLIDELRNNG